MTIDAIREMLHQEPFEPFRICLSNGASYRVTNPEMVAVMKSKLFVAIPDSEKWTFVSYLHIAALETLNGHARGARKRRPRA